jgi:putative endonuclease
MEKTYCVYILANRKGGSLYVGVTSDLLGRVWQHKEHVLGGFTARYNIDKLVHYEGFDDPYAAIQREKNLKRWLRAWKVALIERDNPDWEDLYPKLSV